MMRTFIILCLISCTLGCTTARKAEKFYEKNPVLLAKLSAEKFPIREKYLPGTPVHTRVTVPGDSIPCPEPIRDTIYGTLKPGKVKCPPSFRDTVRITDTVYIESTAQLEVAHDRLQVATNSLVKTQTERDMLKRDNKLYFWITGAMGIVILGLIFLVIRKF